MNKNVVLNKNTIVLFVLNILAILSCFLFRTYFIKLGYLKNLVNIAMILNIIIIIIGILFNVILLIHPNKFKIRQSIIIMVIVFLIYLIINTLGVNLINKKITFSYNKTSDKLFSYCNSFECDKYNTKVNGKNRDFIINKSYIDFNGVKNEVEIHTIYDLKGVKKVKAVVYCQNEMFSEYLINEQVKSYFYNFNVATDESLIKKAFDDRFTGDVKKDNITYKVEEVYNDGILTNLKTIIEAKIR